MTFLAHIRNRGAKKQRGASYSPALHALQRVANAQQAMQLSLPVTACLVSRRTSSTFSRSADSGQDISVINYRRTGELRPGHVPDLQTSARRRLSSLVRQASLARARLPVTRLLQQTAARA